MTEDIISLFSELKNKITTFDKDDFYTITNKIRHILIENDISNYFEKLSLLGLGTQLALLTNHHKSDWFRKELCYLISNEGKNYFNDDMSLWIDMVATGLESNGNNISFLDDIDFTSTFLTDFSSGKYPNYQHIPINLRSIANGRFTQANLSICFGLYFTIMGLCFDFPDNDIKTIIDLLNYYILIPENERLNRFNLELERFFSNFINIDFSERRYFYTDLPFIYTKIAEKKEKSDDEITVITNNGQTIKTKIRKGILSEFQTVSRSLELLLSLENNLNPTEENKMRLILFERVFYNKRRMRQENSRKENKIFLMQQTPYGMFKVPEHTKLHNESALALFEEAISVFKSISEENQQELGKNLYGKESIYSKTLNLEHGVAICLYMLLKEMSFDDVKTIFYTPKEIENTGLMNKLLDQIENTNKTQPDEVTWTDKTTLLEQMLFFMFWEICGYANSESKDKEHQFESWLKNQNILNDSALDFTTCFHPFRDFQKPEILQTIQQLKIPFNLAVTYRNPFWWKQQLKFILNWNAMKNHLNPSNFSNNEIAFDDNILNISDLKDNSLLVELLFRFSRTEPEFKENIIAILNHLREVQKEKFPVYFDKKEKCYNQDALDNQKKIKDLDRGFWIPAIYQSIYPFNTEVFIQKYGKKFFCRNIIECRLFNESGDVLYYDDKNRILKNYRETNKNAMYTRYLYLDRNNYVHNGTSRTIKELLKPEKYKDLLLTLADILLYLDSDSKRYIDDKIKNFIAQNVLFSSMNEVCTESIRKECKTLASLIMKIKEAEPDEITISVIEEFAARIKQNDKLDYSSEISRNEYLMERLSRLLNIIFLTYEPDFNSHSIDFLIEHKTQILLYIASVTYKLSKEV